MSNPARTLTIVLAGWTLAACGSIPPSERTARARSLNPNSPWFHEGDGPGWEFDIIAGVEAEPEYAGSDDLAIEPDGFLRATWLDEPGDRYWVALGGLGLATDFNPDVTLTAELEYEEGREGESQPLEDFEDVDATIELQVGLWKRLGNWTLGAVAQPDLLGGIKGNVAFVALGYDTMLSDDLRFDATADVSWGDNLHHDVEFGVNARDSAASGLRQYDPAGGIKSTSLGVGFEYFVSDAWSVLLGAEAEYYFDEAADGPLIEEEGSRVTVEGLLGVRFSF